ncbi:MAG TPA: lipoyl(octanoyl) transferase LipB [Brevundimonas sp.]|jgi:lipoyl(octanoyl) transferase|uniref:lipoyl(octanoyl) transferase LipB n=1 Tax=Brevundimonas sp. TaxID=1871086 RepID=UPI002DEFB809|nr:lipoyl(octanoyl) transferase LipB [Brevundimonas sp.]
MLSQSLNSGDSRLLRADGAAVEWVVSPGRVDHPQAVAEMEARVAAIAGGRAPERVWLLEHPPLYTAGVTSREEDLLDPRFPVHRTGRGGQFTYHGPGQRVAYVMLDLNARGRDVRAFVRGLERWLIGALDRFGVEAGVRDGRVGVWVERKGPGWSREDKIAAIGVKVRKWVSFHGVSLNVEPDLTHFGGIVPCGITEHGVTSLVDLGVAATMDEADGALRTSFQEVFGPVQIVPAR